MRGKRRRRRAGSYANSEFNKSFSEARGAAISKKSLPAAPRFGAADLVNHAMGLEEARFTIWPGGSALLRQLPRLAECFAR